MSDQNRPLIVGFVADLMFTTRIENTARRLGFDIRWVADEKGLAVADPQDISEGRGERLHGRGGALFAQITAWTPALLLFDLTNTAVPWQQWIAVLKSSPATRRIPILCFGPHTDVDMMGKARSAGADQVLARSRFVAAMPQLFTKLARLPDHEALRDGCAQPLPDLAARAIVLFNSGEYYKCHDDLELVWREEKGPSRDLYRGVLQVGIALYQIQRGNYRGALKMLLRVRQWLAALPPVCRTVNVARLRGNAEAYYQQLTELGPVRVAEFDWSVVEAIELIQK